MNVHDYDLTSAEQRDAYVTGSRDLRAKVTSIAGSMRGRLRESVLDPQRTPNAAVLVKAGEVTQLLNVTETLAHDYGRVIQLLLEQLDLVDVGVAERVDSLTQSRNAARSQAGALRAEVKRLSAKIERLREGRDHE